MTCIDKKLCGFKSGKKMMDCLILSDTVPDPLPTDGTNVDGMTKDEVFAPGSILYVGGTISEGASRVYLAGETGVFAAQ